MSQATDLIGELKQNVTQVEKHLKTFEKDVEQVGEFTDLGHLNVALVHVREFASKLASRRENAENEAQAAEAEPQEPAEDSADVAAPADAPVAPQPAAAQDAVSKAKPAAPVRNPDEPENPEPQSDAVTSAAALTGQQQQPSGS